jgi:hypothetical protein
MANVQTTEVNVKTGPLNVGPYNIYSERSLEDEQLLIRPFFRKTKK